MAKKRKKAARTQVPSSYLAVADPPASGAQRAYIERLLRERTIPETFEHWRMIQFFQENKLDKNSASILIDALSHLPRVYRGRRAAGRTADLPEVPAGHYCLHGTHGKADFYRVRHGEAEFDGWTYLDIQAGPEFHPITDLRRARQVLEDIHKDPKRAAERYAHLLRRCFRCRQELTNRLSRKVGCGAVCAAKSGWYTQEIVDLLKRADDQTS